MDEVLNSHFRYFLNLVWQKATTLDQHVTMKLTTLAKTSLLTIPL